MFDIMKSRPLQNPTNAVIPANTLKGAGTLWGTGAGIQKSLISLDVPPSAR
jgi:hypothetical protein